MMGLLFVGLLLLFYIASHVNNAEIVSKSSNEFLWGVATAAYQIEGATSEDGRGPSIWDTFSLLPSKITNRDDGDVADDSYHQYKKDVELIKNMNGVKAYRFSVSWSRILPNGFGAVNEKAIDHYNLVINELVAAGIEPLVTLYHWDLPQGLEDKYSGWLSPQVEVDFKNFAEICFERFGDRVKKWITINEPWTSCFMGYVLGIFAPGRCSDRSKCPQGNSSTEGYIAAHNMLNAHAVVVQLYREKFQPIQHGVIGITLNHDWGEPLTTSAADIEAANTRNEFAMGWFADPIVFGRYPQSMVDLVGSRMPQFTPAQQKLLIGSYDFIGLNHYSSKYYSKKIVVPGSHVNASLGGWADDQMNVESNSDLSGRLIGAQAASKWLNVVPWGFYNVIMWTTHRYQRPLLYITENGVDAPGESDLPMIEALDDQFRIGYYKSYLSAMRSALRDGANIAGYFAWSLLDNFEWADGYSCRFGLHYVDYNDPLRTRFPKASAGWFAQYATQHPTVASLLAQDWTLSKPPPPLKEPPSSVEVNATEKSIRSVVTEAVTWMHLFNRAVEAAVENSPCGGQLFV